MATVHDPIKSATRQESLFDSHLSRAMDRVRSLQLKSAFAGFIIIMLAYAGVMIACGVAGMIDHRLEIPLAGRQALFVLYVVGSIAYLALTAGRPLLLKVNPYYAARQIEKSVPSSKNSIVNWLDLRNRDMPAGLRAAMSQRAAQDLARANLGEAISDSNARRLGLVGLLASVFLTLGLVLLATQHYPVLSLLGRAFDPFSASAPLTRTQIELLQPRDGDLVLPAPKSVHLVVNVTGRVPEPKEANVPKLLYRKRPTERFEERRLDHVRGSEWSSVIPAAVIESGLWYKVTAGDAETPEYRIAIVPPPQLTGTDVSLHYRPYLCRSDRKIRNHSGDFKELRGTEVNMLVHTNKRIKDGILTLEQGDSKRTLTAEVPADDPQAMRFRFVIDHNGKYRMRFASEQGEMSPEFRTYSIEALPDLAPFVLLTKPSERIELPANGILRAEGSASDDFGITRMHLHMEVIDGPVLQPKVYRPERSFRAADGSYPRKLDYKDFVELEKVKDAGGKPFTLQPGMQVAYWLEATDNCDYPAPNVGKSTQNSPRHLIKIIDPQRDQQKKDQDHEQAQQEQDKHEQNQDKKLQNQQSREGDESDRQENQGTGSKTSPRQDNAKGNKPQTEQTPNDSKPEQASKQEGSTQPGQMKAPGDKPRQENKPGEAQGAKPDQENKQDGAAQPGQKQEPGDKPHQEKNSGDTQAAKPEQGKKQDGAAQPGQKQNPGDKPREEKNSGDTQAAKPEQGNKQDGAVQPGQKQEQGDKPREEKNSGDTQAAKPEQGNKLDGAAQTGQKVEPGDKPQQDKNPGEAQGPKPDQENKQNVTVQPGQKKDPGDKPQQEKKPGEAQGAKPDQGNKEDVTVQPGQKKDPGDKPQQEKQPGEAQGAKPDQRNKEDVTVQPGQKKDPGDKPQQEKNSGIAQAGKPEQGNKQDGAAQSGQEKELGSQKADQKDSPKADKSPSDTQKRSDEKIEKVSKAMENADRKNPTADRQGDDIKKDSDKPDRKGEGPVHGQSTDRTDQKANKPDDSPGTPPGDPADPRHRERPGVLQLERRLDQLQELKRKLEEMPLEERAKLFRDVKENDRQFGDELNREMSRVKKNLQRAAGPPLPAAGPQKVVPGTGTPTDAKQGGSGLPPLEYRDAYKNFTRKLAESQEPQPKKD